jgi:hypothetical protein
VTTIVDGTAKIVKNNGWFQYDSTATTGGYPPDTGAGRWFSLSNPDVGVTGGFVLKSANFTAEGNKSYGIYSNDIIATFPSALTEGLTLEFFAHKGVFTIGGNPALNGRYTTDAIFDTEKQIKLFYMGGADGWVCEPAFVLYGITQDLTGYCTFDSTLLDSTGNGRTWADTGTTPITYASNALNFDNATADYQVTQSAGVVNDIKPSVSFTRYLGFSIIANITSSTGIILSEKITGGGGYTFTLRALNSTTIEFEVTTSGGTFTVTQTLTTVYGTPILIFTEINLTDSKISLQLGDSATLSAIASTTFTGTFAASDNLVIGQTDSGTQFVGLIKKWRFYQLPLSDRQRSLLFNNGAF